MKNSNWSALEEGVSQAAQRGEIVDVSLVAHQLGLPNPRLSGGFIEDLLSSDLDQPYQSKVPTSLVLRNAAITSDAVLNGRVISKALTFDHCQFSGALNLSHCQTSQSVAVTHCSFAKGITAVFAEFRGSFAIEDSSLGQFDLSNSQLFGPLKLIRISIERDVDLVLSKIHSGIVISEIAARDINLNQAKVLAGVKLSNSTLRNLSADRAQIADSLEMEKVKVDEVSVDRSDIHFLGLYDSSLSTKLSADGARVNHQICIHDAFLGELAASKLEIKNAFHIQNTKLKESLNVKILTVEGWLEFDRLSCDDHIIIGYARVAAVTTFSNMSCLSLTIRASRFESDFEITDSTAQYGASFISTIISGRAHIRSLVTPEVDLTDCQFQSILHFSKGQHRFVHIHGVTIAGDLHLPDMKVDGTVGIHNCTIGGEFSLARTTLRHLDLPHSRVAGPILLANHDGRVTWLPSSTANFSECSVGRILDDKGTWPQRLSLSNFKFGEWQEYENRNIQNSLSHRSIEWFDQWLEKCAQDSTGSIDRSSLQSPARYLANKFEVEGLVGNRDHILYRVEENIRALNRGLNWQYLRRSTYWMLLGHGFRVHRSIFVALSFCVVSAVVFHANSYYSDPIHWEWSIFDWLILSVQNLIPGLSLDSDFSKIGFSNWARYWLYAHRGVGFILAAAIVGWLATVVRKR